MLRPFPILVLVISLSLASQARAQQPDANATIATLKRDIPVLMQQADIPGLSIALVSHGHTAWVHSFGTVDPSTLQPVTDQTLFSAASLSKTVFAYAVLQLVDQGKLDLDTPLTHYWPERVVDPQDDPRLDKITARIVLSHRTGFPNWRQGNGLRIFFEPGSRFSYSGEGFVYLQHTVEHIEGKPINQIVQQLVFAPLGMTRSTYISQAGPGITLGYTPALKPRKPIKALDGNAASSLLTNAHDYGLFLEAIVSGRRLKPATLRQMETPQIAVDPTCTNCTNHSPQKLSTDLFWGLGWGIEQTSTGKYLWHWGDNGAFKAFVLVDLHRRNAVVFFANGENGLSIAPAIVHEAIGGDHPAFGWIKYDPYDAVSMRFIHDSIHKGAEVLTTYTQQLNDGTISKETLNSAGYFLSQQKKYDDAIAIFNCTLQLHPDSFYAYNNLGDTYASMGNIDLAVKNYQKALELDPTQEDTKAALAKLQSGSPQKEAAH